MSHICASSQPHRRKRLWRLILWHVLGGCCDRRSYHNYGDDIMTTIKIQGCAQVTGICICYVLNCWRNLSVRASHTFSCWTLLCRPSVVRLASLDGSWSCAVCSHLRREPERPRKCTSCCSQVWMAINLRERQPQFYIFYLKQSNHELACAAWSSLETALHSFTSATFHTALTSLTLSGCDLSRAMSEKCWQPVDKTALEQYRYRAATVPCINIYLWELFHNLSHYNYKFKSSLLGF